MIYKRMYAMRNNNKIYVFWILLLSLIFILNILSLNSSSTIHNKHLKIKEEKISIEEFNKNELIIAPIYR